MKPAGCRDFVFAGSLLTRKVNWISPCSAGIPQQSRYVKLSQGDGFRQRNPVFGEMAQVAVNAGSLSYITIEKTTAVEFGSMDTTSVRLKF